MSHSDESDERSPSDTSTANPNRRRFVTNASRVAMAAGLGGGYAMLGAVAGRYLYPSGDDTSVWQFVAIAEDFAVGTSRPFRTPNGEAINIMRSGSTESALDFVALSSTCPHLGCQVHWEAPNDRFYCPCHNGVFDPSGQGVSGPPEGQTLAQYPLMIDKGLLFVRVPTTRIGNNGTAARR